MVSCCSTDMRRRVPERGLRICRCSALALTQIRVVASNHMRVYVSQGISLLNEKGHDSVELRAIGRAINKTVGIGGWGPNVALRQWSAWVHSLGIHAIMTWDLYVGTSAVAWRTAWTYACNGRTLARTHVVRPGEGSDTAGCMDQFACMHIDNRLTLATPTVACGCMHMASCHAKTSLEQVLPWNKYPQLFC